MKYTLQEFQIKVLEEIRSRHKQLQEDCINNVNDTSLVVSANDMMNTFETMDIIFSDLIELENE